MDINARQLAALDFNYLDQSETYQYNENQLARAKGCAPIVAKLQEFITPWEQAKQRFDESYRKMTTAGQTKTNETLDGERDKLTSGFSGTVSNAKKSPLPGQAEAATVLEEVIKRYDIKTDGELEQQTMKTSQMCTDLLTNYQAQLTTLGLTAWVEALQAKNEEFNAAMTARTNSQAGYIKSELSQLRQQLITAYRNFAKMLNVVLIYEGDTAYADAVDQMNAEVRHYKQIIARKGGKVSAGSDGTGTTTPTNPSTGDQGDQGGSTTPTNPDTPDTPENPGTNPGTGGGTTTPTDPNPNPGGGGTGGTGDEG